MSIDHWLDVPGREVMEKMGPVEWEEPGGYRFKVEYDADCADGTWWLRELWDGDGSKPGDWFVGTCEEDRVALALLRDHAREWLAERKVALYADTQDGEWRWYTVRLGTNGIRARLMGDGSWLSKSTVYINLGLLFVTDYDQALIAAVQATEVA